MRIEISYKPDIRDGKATKVLGGLNPALAGRISGARVVDVYLVNINDRDLAGEIAELFSDPVAQDIAVCDDGSAGSLLQGAWIAAALPGWDFAAEISYKAGVTDPVAKTARQAILLELAGRQGIDADELVVQTASMILASVAAGEDAGSIAGEIVSGLYNPLIQQQRTLLRGDIESGRSFPALYPVVNDAPVPPVETFPIATMDDDELAVLSKERLLALDIREMRAIKDTFADQSFIERRLRAGLEKDITDVELEMLAQTWSEHCKHKIFQAEIEYDDGSGEVRSIDGLFKNYIKKTTDDLTPGRPDLRSVFHDDSGVVDFDDDFVICFKAETHNSPSALDPYGGAITGIVGVNRDIMGTGKGARPIFNTNVLCFGHPDTDPAEIPRGLLHPRTVMHGVHEGIIDGGNQSGIPTVGGAFLFDDSYLGKPLVFCGTGGIMPRKINGEESWIQHIDSGDLAVMLGGRIGKDGIHGATFSSLALDEDSPTSAVQIGDPITQRKMLDFLQEARDAGLYKGITDNGAGGLSSSLGEMAEFSGGIRVDLDRAPLKYRGLAPWEIWVSESQERMSLAVHPDKLAAFTELARRRDVEATVVGQFTDSGSIELRFEEQTVGLLPLGFVHDGVPRMRLRAKWIAPQMRRSREQAREYIRSRRSAWDGPEFVRGRLLELLTEPNIRSKEQLIRQYDHEVQGQSVVKPFTGIHADAPSDGAVLLPLPGSRRGITVTHGICPQMSDDDAYQMAAHAVDEAYRAHIALGGHPDRASGLDNFCWPDPVQSAATPDGEYKLAQLVRANEGMRNACMAYNLPLISGKDSMKNDAFLGGKKVSVRPTLLVSLMGIVEDVSRIPDQGIYRPGLELYLLGSPETRLGGGFFEKLEGRQLGESPTIDLPANARRYRTLSRLIAGGLIEAIHDVSDGGLLTALAESCLAGRTGAEISLDALAAYSPEASAAQLLFAEGAGRFVVAVQPEASGSFRSAFTGDELFRLGTSGGSALSIGLPGKSRADIGLEEIERVFIRSWQTGGEMSARMDA
jgi:phosphoribosylformylglycinamidine synthase II